MRGCGFLLAQALTYALLALSGLLNHGGLKRKIPSVGVDVPALD